MVERESAIRPNVYIKNGNNIFSLYQSICPKNVIAGKKKKKKKPQRSKR